MPGPSPDFSAHWAAAEPAVAGFLAGILPDRQAADEVRQEVAVAAFRGFAQWRPDAPFAAWVIGIARNLVRMRWRTLARSRTVFADPELLDQIAAINAELDDELEEERRALRHCLEGVQGRARDLLRLHYVDGLTPALVAERLALAAGTVRVQLHRLRAVLQACIARRIAAERARG